MKFPRKVQLWRVGERLTISLKYYYIFTPNVLADTTQLAAEFGSENADVDDDQLSPIKVARIRYVDDLQSYKNIIASVVRSTFRSCDLDRHWTSKQARNCY